MARMYYSYKNISNGFSLTTVFENGEETTRQYMIGDAVENLRYVFKDEIRFATGTLVDIAYTMADGLMLDLEDPTDVLDRDMILSTITVRPNDGTKDIIIPLREIVEFDGEFGVARMKFAPFIKADLTLKFSDYRIERASIEVGDTFNKVKIINPDDVPNPYTGKFTVLSFAYTSNGPNDFNVYGVAFKNVNTGEIVVTDFENIHALNEVYSYDIPSVEALDNIIANLADGDSVIVTNNLDTSGGNGIKITQKDIEINIDSSVVTDGTKDSGIRVTGSAILNGPGKVVNNTPYSGAASGYGVIGVTGDGELTINGGGVIAVIDDPVNNGQFGITTHDNAKVTINGGGYAAGWYCVSGNGSGTSANAVTTINDGTFVSVADYAIYHPHPGKLIVNGGEISGAAGAIAANNGTIEINGGTFDVLGDGDTGTWPDGTSGLGEACINLNARYGDVTCVINDGKFKVSATNDATKMINVNKTLHNVNLTINGGKFQIKPEAEWLAPGKNMSTIVDSEDGLTYWIVK